MPYWVISADKKGKLVHSGPFMTAVRAQKYADDNVHSKLCEIVETRGRNWDTARGEVKYKLAEIFRDAGYGTKRIFEEG